MADCTQLNTEIEEITVLRRLVDEAVKDAAATGNVSRAKELSERLKMCVAALKTKVEKERIIQAWPDPFYHPKNIGRIERKQNYREVEEFSITERGSVYAMQVLPDGSIVTGGDRRRVSIIKQDEQGGWNEKVIRPSSQKQGEALTLQALPDGRIIVSGSNSIVEVLEEEAGEWKQGQGFGVFDGHVTKVRALPDGRIITANDHYDVGWRFALQHRIFGRRRSTLREWKEGEKKWEEKLLPGHKGATTAVDVLPDGRMVTGGRDQEIHVLEERGKSWHSDTIGKVSHRNADKNFEYKMHVQAMGDGRILSAGGDGHIYIWKEESGVLSSGEPFHEWRATEVGSVVRRITDIQMLPDERIIVSVDSSITGMGNENFVMFEKDDKGNYHEKERIGDNRTIINAFQALPDGRILSAAESGWMRIWDGRKVDESQDKITTQ
jgi:WD40 repeat protein